MQRVFPMSSKPQSVPASSHARFVLHSQLLPEFGVGWSNVHLLRLEKEGKFPLRVRIGNNTVAWLFAELVAWVEQRVAQSRGAA